MTPRRAVFASSRTVLAFATLGLLIIAACSGPMLFPMVDRLDELQQLEVERNWKNLVDAGADLDRQGWLDVMVSTFAFQRGVDRLEFHSEKEIDDRLVVMEVRYDRAQPQKDAFDITIFDEERKILRKESYSREDVEEVILAMYRAVGTPKSPPPGVETVDDWSQYWKRADARRERVRKLFPISEGNEPPADALLPQNVVFPPPIRG